MTGPTGAGRADGAAGWDAFVQATEDLGRLRELLERAGRGRAGPGEVQQAVNGYAQQHGGALSTAAAAVGEQVRLQILAELYRWREQLSQQRTRRTEATVRTAPDSED